MDSGSGNCSNTELEIGEQQALASRQALPPRLLPLLLFWAGLL